MNYLQLEKATYEMCRDYHAENDSNVMAIRSLILQLVLTMPKLYEEDGLVLMKEFFEHGSLSFCNYKFR